MSKQSAGGKARAAILTPEERSQIAKAGAAKRWAGRHKVPLRKPGAGFIYGVGTDKAGPLKIGRTSDVAFRLKHLQMGNPLVLVPWFSVEVPQMQAYSVEHVERQVHHLLREHRIRGEWFDVAADIAEQAAMVALEEIQAKHFAPRRDDGETILLYLPDATLERVRAYAERRGIKLGAACLELISRAEHPERPERSRWR